VGSCGAGWHPAEWRDSNYDEASTSCIKFACTSLYAFCVLAGRRSASCARHLSNAHSGVHSIAEHQSPYKVDPGCRTIGCKPVGNEQSPPSLAVPGGIAMCTHADLRNALVIAEGNRQRRSYNFGL